MLYTKNEVLHLLDAQGTAYELAAHPAVFTIPEMLALDLPHADAVAKNLFLRDDKKRNYYLVTVREEKHVDLKALRTALGARPLSFASPADLERLLGLTAGAVTPFGALNDAQGAVRVCFDIAFCGQLVGVHPNDNTATVFLQTEALAALLAENGHPVTYIEV